MGKETKKERVSKGKKGNERKANTIHTLLTMQRPEEKDGK